MLDENVIDINGDNDYNENVKYSLMPNIRKFNSEKENNVLHS